MCNYTRCDSSGFVVDGKCFTLSREMTHSAMEAHQKCAASGGMLARLPTRSLTKKILAVTSKKINYEFYIGLRSHVPGFPSL